MTTTQPTEFENPYGGTMRVMQNGLAFYDMEDKPFMFESPEQAHRAALAILTGPGKVQIDQKYDEDAMSYLDHGTLEIARHIAALDAKAAAEAEAAELRAEALAILNAMYPGNPAPDWDDWSAESQDLAIAAARAAREARWLHTNKETQHG